MSTSEDLTAALDTTIDQYNEILAHATTTTSSLDGKLRAVPSLRISMGVAGVMELGRRRELFVDGVARRGARQGHTLTDHTVCADQLEEHILSSGNLRYGEDVETTRGLLTRYWRYRQEEILGQRDRLVSRWSKYCRTSDMIARTQTEYRRTLVALSEEYDRHAARILRLERSSANPPLPTELEHYCMWLLRRQQCNETLRRFYLLVQWLAHSHRSVIAVDIQQLLISQQEQQEQRNEEGVKSDQGNSSRMTNNVNGLLRTVLPLLAEYYRGGPGQMMRDDDSWSGEPTVEDDYRTESSFLQEFRQQSSNWNFLPYGAADNQTRHDDAEEREKEQQKEQEEDLPSIPVYIKPATWTPHVQRVEETLYHVGHALSRTTRLSLASISDGSTVRSIVGGGSAPPEVPSVRSGQEHRSRAAMDQIMLTELECLQDNDGNMVLSRLTRLCNTHSSRCCGKTTEMKDKQQRNKQISTLQRLMPSLHDRSEAVFERKIGDKALRKQEEEEEEEEEKENVNMTETEEGKQDKDEVERNSGIVMFRSTLVRILYRQRHLKLRSQRRRLLGLLNYCRSVQRRITMEQLRMHQQQQQQQQQGNTSKNMEAATSERTSHPTLDLQHELHRTPLEPDGHMYQQGTEQSRRPDEYMTEASTCTFGSDVVHVIDSSGLRVVYDAALSDLEIMEQLLLSVGTRATQELERRNTLTRGSARASKSASAAALPDNVVDRCTMLMELFACEVGLKESTRKYVDVLLSIYDSTLHTDEKQHVASEILETMRARPYHERQESEKENSCHTNFKQHYDLLIAKMNEKRKLLNNMFRTQVDAERKTRSSTRLHSNNNSSLETIFEITLSMGNVARFFPLYTTVIGKIMENMSTTYLGKTGGTRRGTSGKIGAAVLHVGHVELCTLRALQTMYSTHVVHVGEERDARAVKFSAQKSTEENKILSNAKASAWSITCSDLLILLRRQDEMDQQQKTQQNSSSSVSTKEAEKDVAQKALDSLVRHARDDVGIARKTSRRVALIDVLLLREEGAFEKWECEILQGIYTLQVKSFGSDVVHRDRVFKTSLENLEDTSLTTMTKMMQLQSNTDGGLTSLKQWSVGSLFDPAVCRDAANSLTRLLEKQILPHQLCASNPALNNAQRKMAMVRLRDTVRCQASEKGVLMSCVSANRIVLEALEFVEVLGEREFQHRRQSANSEFVKDTNEEEDQTFLTTRRSVSASEMRQTIKTERHRLRDMFCSAYQPRVSVRKDVMVAYQIRADNIVSKHHQRNAAAADLQSTLDKGNKGRNANRRGSRTKKETDRDHASVTTGSSGNSTQLALEMELCVLKSNTLKEEWVRQILLTYRAFALLPQVLQQYQTIGSLTEESRRWRKRFKQPTLYTHVPYKFGCEREKTRRTLSQHFVTKEGSQGSIQNALSIPNWQDIYRMVMNKNDADDMNEGESGSPAKRRKRMLEHVHTMLIHGQVTKKLIEALRLRCRLISCGTASSALYAGDRGTSARRRSAIGTAAGDDPASQEVAALDAFCHELDKLKLGMERIMGHGYGNIVEGADDDEMMKEMEDQLSDELSDELTGGADAVLKYLCIRSQVEVHKLRSSLTFSHDQVTGVCPEETIPRRRRINPYSTVEDQEKEANAAGVTLQDWLEAEKLDNEGKGRRVEGLHLRVLQASRSSASDFDDSAIHTTLHCQESHLSLSSKCHRTQQQKILSPISRMEIPLLSGSPGYISNTNILTELLDVDQHVSYGHAAGDHKHGGKHRSGRGSSDGGTSQDNDGNEHVRTTESRKGGTEPWSVQGASTPWRWDGSSSGGTSNRAYHKFLADLFGAESPHQKSGVSTDDRLQNWGPYVGLVLPNSLSLWYTYAWTRFDRRLTPTLRNHLGASLQAMELKVDGATMVAMSANASTNTNGTGKNSGGHGVAVGSKRWRDLPAHAKKTRRAPNKAAPLVEAMIQHNYLKRSSILRSYKLALLSLYSGNSQEKQQQQQHQHQRQHDISSVITHRISNHALQQYHKNVTTPVQSVLDRLRSGKDISACKKVQDSILSLLPPSVVNSNNTENSASSHTVSSQYSSMTSIQTEQESQRLGKEVSGAHLLSLEIDQCKEALSIALLQHQRRTIEERRSILHEKSTVAIVEMNQREQERTNNASRNNRTQQDLYLREDRITSVMKEERSEEALINLFRSNMLQCLTEVSPFSQDRPLIRREGIEGKDSNEGKQNSDDPRRRKYQLYVDAFEQCLDTLGTDVQMLLKQARYNAKLNPLNHRSTTTGSTRSISSTGSTSSTGNNNATTMIGTAVGFDHQNDSLLDLCRQLSHQLLCREQAQRMQGHTFKRRVDVMAGRNESEITRRCYGLLFEIDRLHADNRHLRATQSQIKKKADRASRKRYRSQIAVLEQQLTKSNALFGQYKESMKSDMLSEISTAKKAALLKIVDSSTVTKELRQRAIKIAAVEDEIHALKRDNGDLRRHLAQERLERKTERVMLETEHEEKVCVLEDELKEKSKAWGRQTAMERRDVLRQKELNLAQTASSRLVKVVSEMSVRLESVEKAKKKLQQWKIRNQHTMVMLEKQMVTLSHGLSGNGDQQTQEDRESVVQKAREGLIQTTQDSRETHDSDDKEEREDIREARQWSEAVLEKRHQNHVTSLTRQLTREKKQHRSTTDMLRRSMSKLRDYQKKDDARQLTIVDHQHQQHNQVKEKEWNNAKEEQLMESRLREDRTRNELLQTRARLGSIKEEHARLLEYLSTMGITAPGGDVTNFSASRYMSGFTNIDAVRAYFFIDQYFYYCTEQSNSHHLCLYLCLCVCVFLSSFLSFKSDQIILSYIRWVLTEKGA